MPIKGTLQYKINEREMFGFEKRGGKNGPFAPKWIYLQVKKKVIIVNIYCNRC